jgi:hypothetical protein
MLLKEKILKGIKLREDVLIKVLNELKNDELEKNVKKSLESKKCNLKKDIDYLKIFSICDMDKLDKGLLERINNLCEYSEGSERSSWRSELKELMRLKVEFNLMEFCFERNLKKSEVEGVMNEYKNN